jgi:hypothetical protein
MASSSKSIKELEVPQIFTVEKDVWGRAKEKRARGELILGEEECNHLEGKDKIFNDPIQNLPKRDK